MTLSQPLADRDDEGTTLMDNSVSYPSLHIGIP